LGSLKEMKDKYLVSHSI